MASYAYRGRNAQGEQVEGVLDGDSSGAIADQLASIGVTPVDIAPSRSAEVAEPVDWRRLFAAQARISPIEVMLFSRQMYTLLKAGVPILRALAGLQESTGNGAFAALLQDLRESLDSGRELSVALRRHPRVFSAFYVSMVQVGEMTGTLDLTFMRLYTYLEFERDMKERIGAALRYPVFVLIAMGVAIVVINLFVIPTFARVYAGMHAELPFLTRALLGFSAYMVSYWPLMLLAAAGIVAGLRYRVATPEGRIAWDRYKLRLPFAGPIILKATLSRFARSLALAFGSGMPILQGLSAVGRVVDNEYMREKVEKMREGIEGGESILRTASSSGIFDPVVLQMIAVGEEAGDLDGLMAELADMYEQEVKYEVVALGAKIEPVLVVAMGVLVLLLALGVFLPMWDLGRAAMH